MYALPAHQSPRAWLTRVPFTRARRDEPSPYAMDGFSNVTTVTVDDPLGNQLADAMDGLRCSRSTRAVEPPVVPQQTARQQKVVEELANSMVSHTPLGTQAQHGRLGLALPGLVGADWVGHCWARTARHHVLAPSHRAWSPSHPPPTTSAAALPTSPSSPRMPLPPLQRTLDVHVDVYDADGRVRKPSAASRLLGSVSSPTAPWARRSTPVPPPPASRPPPARLPPAPRALPSPRPSPRHHRCCGHHLSCLLAHHTDA